MTMSTDRTTHATGTGQYAEVNGINLYYETHGSGRPLILLHGGLGSGEMFEPVVPQLAESHQVVTVDLQGHGRTADIDRPLDAVLMAGDIAALIDTSSWPLRTWWAIRSAVGSRSTPQPSTRPRSGGSSWSQRTFGPTLSIPRCGLSKGRSPQRPSISCKTRPCISSTSKSHHVPKTSPGCWTRS